MENASKALLMSAAVMIAVLVIALARYMFSAASGVTKTYDSQMQSTEATSFNAHFTQFYGATVTDTGTSQQYATIYDVITCANFAYDQNKENQANYIDFNDPTHIRVDLKGRNTRTLECLENYVETKKQQCNELLKKCYYQNNSNPNVNLITEFEVTIVSQNAEGKINHVIFTATSTASDPDLSTIITSILKK